MGGVAIQHPHYYTIHLLNNLRQLVTMPPWQTVYDHFSKWNKLGVWERIVNRLNQIVRIRMNRKTISSYGIIDAQSVKTQYASEEREIDGGQKSKGPQTPYHC